MEFLHDVRWCFGCGFHATLEFKPEDSAFRKDGSGSALVSLRRFSCQLRDGGGWYFGFERLISSGLIVVDATATSTMAARMMPAIPCARPQARKWHRETDGRVRSEPFP